MEFTSIIFFFTLVPALLFLLLPAAAVIALQVWLCRRDRQWLGLILPALTLVLSLTVCLGALAFSTMTTVGSSTVLEDGTVVEGPTENQIHLQDLTPQTAVAAAALFLVFNIPTAVLLGIWFYHRSRRALREELRKMTVQDLE